MQVENLISTMNQTTDSILDRMNIQSAAVVINQCDHFEWREYRKDGYPVRFFDCNERGVGLSRNNALMRAKGDICLFSDDDLTYFDGYALQIAKAFEDISDADAIVFNIHSKNNQKKRYQITKVRRVHWFNYMRYGAARLAVRRESVLKANISFSLLFGGGTRYSCGEDTIFLHDCLNAGLHIYAVPITLAEVDDSRSTWFRGYNKKYLHDRGALYACIYRHYALMHCLLFLLRHKVVWEATGNMLYALSEMRKGIRFFRASKHDSKVSAKELL